MKRRDNPGLRAQAVLRPGGFLDGVPLTLPSPARLGVFLGGAAFCVLFHVTYVLYVSRLFGYIGANYDPPPGAVRALPWILALAPVLFWMPARVTRPSQFFLWVLYCTVYVPSIFVPFYGRVAADQDTIRFMLTLAVSYATLGIFQIAPPRLPSFRISPAVFWLALAALTVLLDLYVLTYFHGHLRLVTLGNVLQQRLAARAVVRGTGLGYAMNVLANAIDPFLMAYGLERRRRSIFLAGAAGQVFLYAAAANKIHLLSIPVILVVRWLLRGDGRHFGILLTGGIAMAMAVACIIQGSNPVAGILMAVLMLRTVTLPGLLSAQYLAFFGAHPHTQFAHVHGISWFVRYPYEISIPHAIGEYFYNDPDVNANAHFWVSDGLAGLGFPGMLLVTGLVMLALWLLDGAARNAGGRLAILMSVLQAAALANGSVFSALAGGALWCTWLLAYTVPRGAPARSGVGEAPGAAKRA